MLHSIHHETHVETLLNSLAAERHIRSALLSTLIDELAAAPALAVAAEAARAMMSDVATLSDDALLQRIDALRQLVREHVSPSASSAA